MARLLHIATIANDLTVYQTMRASMTVAGFTEDRCRFTLLDNSKGNQHEPYSVLRQLAIDGDEPYIMLCHQDLLFGQECTLAVLEQQLKALEQIDPNWGIAGTAGADVNGQLILHLDDPSGRWRTKDLPRPVISLDENLLLLQRSHYVPASAGLLGFHLYGTDLCLNAFLRGQKSYVIAFPVHHLSGGDAVSPAFNEAMEKFSAAWSKRLMFALVRTPCAELRIAPFKWLRTSLQGGRLKEFLRRRGMCRLVRPWGGSR